MRIVLLVTLALLFVAVPAASASTLQLVTENGNVFSVDFDEIWTTWQSYNATNSGTNSTVALQNQIIQLQAQLNSLSNSTGTNSTQVMQLQDQLTATLTELNALNSTATENAAGADRLHQALADAIMNVTNNIDVNMEDLEQAILDLGEQIENIPDGVAAGALGSSGRFVTIQTNDVLAYGNHTSNDNRGIIGTPFPYNFPDNEFDWATVIQGSDTYDEYDIPEGNKRYTADSYSGQLTNPRPLNDPSKYLEVRNLPSNKAWSINYEGDLVYAGVTNNAGRALVKPIPNDGVTITRTYSASGNTDVHIVDRGEVHATLAVPDYGVVNSAFVFIDASCAAVFLIGPDGNIYPTTIVISSYPRIVAVDLEGVEIHGDWTIVMQLRNSCYARSWTIMFNYGGAGEVTSVSGSGNQYAVTVNARNSGLYGLHLMEVNDIRDVSVYSTTYAGVDRFLPRPYDEKHDVGGTTNPRPYDDPYVVSIERNNPTTLTFSSSGEYLVTFNRPVFNVDVGDFFFTEPFSQKPVTQSNETPLNVMHSDTQSVPNRNGVAFSNLEYITSAKITVDATGQFPEDFSLVLTTPGNRNIVITDTDDPSSPVLQSGKNTFDVPELTGYNLNGGFVLQAFDKTSRDHGNGEPEGTIDNWSMTINHEDDRYQTNAIQLHEVSGSNGAQYTLTAHTAGSWNKAWLNSTNDIVDVYDRPMQKTFAPYPHEMYHRGPIPRPSFIPHVASITVANSTHDSATFEVTFSEPVSGVDVTDFLVSKNGILETSGPQIREYTRADYFYLTSAEPIETTDIITINEPNALSANFVSLNINLTNTFLAHLEIELETPDGHLFGIIDNPSSYSGGLGADQALIATYPLDLGAFDDIPFNGDWTLKIRDTSGPSAYAGVLHSWSLDFSYEELPTYDELAEVETQKGSAYTWLDLYGHTLRVYPDALVKSYCDGVFFDPYNNETQCFSHAGSNDIIYVAKSYMQYPITTEVNIGDVRVSADIDCSSPLRFNYLNGVYNQGENMFVPVGPGMPVACMDIEGAEIVVELQDIAAPTQILSFQGDEAGSGSTTFADISATSRTSTVLIANGQVEMAVSFSATGKSESVREAHLRFYDIIEQNGMPVFIRCELTAGRGTLTLTDRDLGGACPIPEGLPNMVIDLNRGKFTESRRAVDYFSTEYIVTIDLVKNGKIHDTVQFPVTSLEPLRPLLYPNYDENSNINEWVRGEDTKTTVRGGVSHSTVYGTTTYHFEPFARQSMTRTAWDETFSHTFEIDGVAGDHVEFVATNRVIYKFPIPFGHYHQYDWELARGDFVPHPDITYFGGDGANVKIGNGAVFITQVKN